MLGGMYRAVGREVSSSPNPPSSSMSNASYKAHNHASYNVHPTASYKAHYPCIAPPAYLSGSSFRPGEKHRLYNIFGINMARMGARHTARMGAVQAKHSASA